MEEWVVASLMEGCWRVNLGRTQIRLSFGFSFKKVLLAYFLIFKVATHPEFDIRFVPFWVVTLSRGYVGTWVRVDQELTTSGDGERGWRESRTIAWRRRRDVIRPEKTS